MVNNFCFHVYAEKSISDTHTLSLSHSLSHSLSRHGEQLLFSLVCSKVTVYRWKLQWFFFDSSSLTTLPCDVWVHRAGSQLKIKILVSTRYLAPSPFILFLLGVHLILAPTPVVQDLNLLYPGWGSTGSYSISVGVSTYFILFWLLLHFIVKF